MAHIQDRWEKTTDGRRIRTDRYGKGRRWRARYLDPDGNERNKTFARKADAERFLASVTSDVLRGAYVDPDAGKVTFGEFARQWLEAQTFGESTREATELRLRLHAEPHLGKRELRTSSLRSSKPGFEGSTKTSPPPTSGRCSPTSPR